MTDVPRPCSPVERDEIGREAEIMRALPRSRFRGLGFKQLKLPQGVSVTLEEFEIGLRLAGLMGVNELLAETTDGPLHFRVKRRHVAIDGHFKPSPRGVR